MSGKFRHGLLEESLILIGDENSTQIFLKLFRHPRDIPAKIPRCPAHNFGSLGSGRTKRVSTKGVSMIRAISGNFP